MRTIKFRAWNGLKMWYPEDKSRDGSYINLTFFPNPQSIGWGLYDNNLKNRLVSGEYSQLMQFTGRKDPNGKDIYEDDMIEHKGVKYRVIWSESKSCFCGITPNVYVDQRGGPTFIYKSMPWIVKHAIIGNIHENPELIK